MSKYDKFEGHTPGEWGIYESPTNICIVSQDIRIAEIIHWVECEKENANLIAAAPSLLEACKRKDKIIDALLTYLKIHIPIEYHDEFVSAAEAELNRDEI